MNSNPTTTPTPATPSQRPDMKGRSSSDGSNYAITASKTLSPTNTLSPLSTQSSSPSTKGHLSFPFPFPRSRSKSPRPPPIDLSIPTSTTIKHAQTSPLPVQSPSGDHPRTQRQASDSAISPSAMSPSSPDLQKRDSWVQKKPRHSGSSPGGYGRHSDDWLFGSISITQTAKEIVHRGRRKKEDSDATGSR
ncbi:uncharacterized protein Z519_03142 [Cladophialophora bantiana CBS 173.52]|uniref:Uncharacterized protein n=1 Tax=Cladophialophora bantiana (strain ATCC 10958 / CBS 173.52 / CDC B-1940 / NIH 8579) TaxID=1442370 RepID=A0A0D2F1M1_CLAB1|nr:uncharacterized protein Z519_03142 [Cladophialophora bantiana CBS 173.52]KIW96076.1 hypothetical protein Z519_03142 [Cladophialophora bantiana CBS 173.52]